MCAIIGCFLKRFFTFVIKGVSRHQLFENRITDTRKDLRDTGMVYEGTVSKTISGIASDIYGISFPRKMRIQLSKAILNIQDVKFEKVKVYRKQYFALMAICSRETMNTRGK